jgi:hypothetical protein
MNPNIAWGFQNKRRNPRRKSRPPHHAKKVIGHLPITGRTASTTCMHALSAHQELDGQTMSFALGCTVQHRPTTKKNNIVHKDASGRKWK